MYDDLIVSLNTYIPIISNKKRLFFTHQEQDLGHTLLSKFNVLLDTKKKQQKIPNDL